MEIPKVENMHFVNRKPAFLNWKKSTSTANNISIDPNPVKVILNIKSNKEIHAVEIFTTAG